MCRNAEILCAWHCLTECQYALCPYAEFHHAYRLNNECHSDKAFYTECHFVESRGTPGKRRCIYNNFETIKTNSSDFFA
jgi:hypothetical protein